MISWNKYNLLDISTTCLYFYVELYTAKPHIYVLITSYNYLPYHQVSSKSVYLMDEAQEGFFRSELTDPA